MEENIKVLVICGHNSGRSQMAEAFLREYGKGRIDVESAGLDPRPVNPLVIEVMKEAGHDLSNARSDSVFQFFKEGRLYDHVITVCNAEQDKRCPTFPGIAKRHHWPFPDPEELAGTHDQKLAALRLIRDDIARKVREWVQIISNEPGRRLE